MITTSKRDGFQGEQSITLPSSVRNQIKSNPLISDLFITDIGFYPHARFHFRKRNHGSRENILIYVTNGSGEVRIKDESFYLSKNDYIIIPKNIAHQYSTKEKDAWTIYWVHFDGTKAEFLKNSFGKRISLQAHHTPNDNFRVNMFMELIHTLSMGYVKSHLEYVNLSFQQLLASFLYPDQFMQHLNVLGADVISKNITYMKENVEKALSLKDLADQAGLSIAHYSKLFTQKTGFSPIDHFIQLKIQHACKLLDISQLYIKEVAHKVGYQDPYYFSRIFKKVMQMSPLEYKKRDRQ
ncbi:AraC family transcriptional regulator of arabinose operon [Catalinimonas alkaloidigena]|uniref:AraC family transcriptional regulator n=1 Tax=Catalinimonas alkaloidigena TaxID=1075417 RepID=UPI00240551DC|nr:AraC family transcriptional regulator [Catalinimonas alkaloidigena]MDF9796404.1 AraC family transcriptional regulator of arabinose operon [Catalinimonas alkaloidigena]